MLKWLFELSVQDDWITVTHKFISIAMGIGFWVVAWVLFALWWVKFRCLPKSWVLLSFGALLLLCGVSRFNDWLTYYWPMERFYAIIDLLMVTAMGATVPLLIFAILRIMRVPTPEDVRELERRNEVLERNRARLQKIAAIKEARTIRLHKAVQTLRAVNEELKGSTTLASVIQELNDLGAEDK